jgi:hypothetical protein
MRDLTSQLDATAESLLDAHGFAMTELSASERGATARYRASDDGGTWVLALHRRTEGTTELRLGEGEDAGARMSLSIQVERDDAAGLARSLGLVVSFLSFARQLRNAA